MQKIPTHFLRFVIFLLGAGALALCIFALPNMWKGGSAEFPAASHAVFLIMICLYLTAVPFFIGLWQALKLLHYIDKDALFTDVSVRAIRNIKYCATAIAVLYVGIVPLLFPIADADDAPGLILMGAGVACLPSAVAVFAAILEMSLKNAIEIKSENDLTV